MTDEGYEVNYITSDTTIVTLTSNIAVIDEEVASPIILNVSQVTNEEPITVSNWSMQEVDFTDYDYKIGAAFAEGSDFTEEFMANNIIRIIDTEGNKTLYVPSGETVEAMYADYIELHNDTNTMPNVIIIPDENLSVTLNNFNIDEQMEDILFIDNLGRATINFSDDKLQINNTEVTFTNSQDSLKANDDSILVADNATLAPNTSEFATYQYYGSRNAEDNMIDFRNIDESLEIDLDNFHEIEKVRSGNGGTNYLIGTYSPMIEGYNFDTDKINTRGLNYRAAYIDDNNSLHIEVERDRSVIIADANNKSIKINVGGQDITAKFGNTLTYDSEADYCESTELGALNINQNEDKEVAILLDGTDGKTYNKVNEIIAGAYSGQTTLVGNAMDNVITASKGKSSLWGGAGDYDDTLIGSNNYNKFFYLKGNDNDIIKSAKSTDIINLYDLSLDDINNAKIESKNINIEFKNGASLSTNAVNNLMFKLADGSKLRVNMNNRS